MSIIGNATFKAGVEMSAGTLVQVASTVDIVPHVIPTSLTFPFIGYTASDAAQYEMVAVIPLTTEGNPYLRYTFFNGVDVGDSLYITTTGTVTDVATGGLKIGESLERITTNDRNRINIDLAGAGGSARADLISIADAGDYYIYPPKVIETALGIIGASFSLDKIVHVQAIDEYRLSPGTATLAQLGGKFASGSLATSSSDATQRLDHNAVEVSTTAIFTEQAMHFYVSVPEGSIVDSSNPFDLSFQMYSQGGDVSVQSDLLCFANYGFITNPLPAILPSNVGFPGYPYDEVFVYTSIDPRFNLSKMFSLKFNLDMGPGVSVFEILAFNNYFYADLPI